MKIDAEFVTSAAGAADFPRDGSSEVALVGRSNVGKSSLINALVGRRLARTSAAPGKTRLANVYRVARGTAEPFYFVDLPGYGYARGGATAAREFEVLTRSFFARADLVGAGSPEHTVAALLLVDARHPGLDSDRAAWQWVRRAVGGAAVVATKMDKLSRAERKRALKQLESVFEDSVLPASAATGEGLDELWKLIDRLANSRDPQQRRSSNNRPGATAPTPRPLSKASRPPRK